MTGFGLVTAGLSLLVAPPLLAQDNSDAPAASAPETVGPRELSNFSLPGTVTRQATPQAQPQTQAPATSPSMRPAERPAAPKATAAAAAERGSAPRGASVPAPADGRADLNAMASRPSLAPAPQATASRRADSPFAGAAPPALPDAAPQGFSFLPLIAALLALAAGAAVMFGLQRRRQAAAASAGAGLSAFLGETDDGPPVSRRSPEPAPPRAAEPRPAATPPIHSGAVVSSLRAPSEPAIPVGLVSSGLRPWIELELEPSQALVTDEQAAISFDVTLFNSGSAPARDVAVEACLINAGEEQDVQLSRFYTEPSQTRDKIPAVAPLARITLKSAVRLPRESVREYEVEGRKLFMPMVAINSRYRWSSGEGQTATSFLVGPAANDTGKLKPLRLDQGARGWRKLAARRYDKGIRK